MEELNASKVYTPADYNKMMQERPIWERSLLTVVEAAKYFQIGESRVRALTRKMKGEKFIVWKDNRVYIRREALEKYLNGTNEI